MISAQATPRSARMDLRARSSPTVLGEAAAWEGVLATFAPATAALVAARGLQRRVDTKFLVPRAAALELITQVTGDYAVLEAGTSRLATYRNVYFDTDGYRCFHDHRRGRRRRFKIRVRHYPERNVSFLEIKHRLSEMLTQKFRAERDYGDVHLRASDLELIQQRTKLGSVAPRACTDFRRASFLSIRGDERFTVDIGLVLRVGDDTLRIGQVAIVEVKQPSLCRQSPIMRALHAAHWRPQSGSKYCSAIALLGAQPCNRLLPRLKQLREVGAS